MGRVALNGWRHEACIGDGIPPFGPYTGGVRIAIGSDHAGFILKSHLVKVLIDGGHDVDDLGTTSEEPVDYPPICAAVAREVAAGRVERGIVLGGSGQGEQIAANKVHGVRAALCNDLYTARLSREHNDANVLSMGGRIVAPGLADEIVTLWLATPFAAGRHLRRVEQIAEIEAEETDVEERNEG
jgi:ribose 5-phosphate isomerase B